MLRSSSRPMPRLPLVARFLLLQRFLLPVLMGGLVLVSLFVLARTVMKSAEAHGGWDLHPYWYYGHFVHAGINPYGAYAEGLTLPGPVHYLDGSVVAPDAVAQPQLGRVPANTAPILLLLSFLSFFPWVVAKSIWLVCNLALIVVIPWLGLRLLPPSLQLAHPVQLMVIVFLILCLSAATTWQLPPRQSFILGFFWLLALTVMCLPSDILRRFLTDA